MLSKTIAEKIMSEMYEEIKGFISEIIANHRSVDFGEIEDKIQDLSRDFSKRLADGALEAIGNGYVGRTIECECGGVMEYHSNSRWTLTSLSGELEIYRAYYYCKECGSSKRGQASKHRCEEMHCTSGYGGGIPGSVKTTERADRSVGKRQRGTARKRGNW
ncbi:MAG: hypothetical protein ACW98J_09025 [Candidatus Thorarchaeota archaeon]